MWRVATILGVSIATIACEAALDASPASTPRPFPSTTVSESSDPSFAPATPITSAVTDFPLAVVTGFSNLRSKVTGRELGRESVIVPCGVQQLRGVREPTDCVDLEQIAARLRENPTAIAVLPPALVSPLMKVLPVDGLDLLGARSARTGDYPVWGSSAMFPAEWTHYDANEVRTVVSSGESCADKHVARAAIEEGRGWEWVVNGGTAVYTRIYPNPVGPGEIGDGFNIFDAKRTGNQGAIKAILQGAGVTVSGYECPVHEDWTIATGTIFGTDPAIPPLLADMGIDVVTVGANHITDQGVSGLAETLSHWDAAGIARTGAGMDLDEALEPAIIDVEGMAFGFVGLNIVPGALEAGRGQPGAAYVTEANAKEGVRRARALGAEVVLCLPEWGWPEYHADMSEHQRELQALLYAAGCDHILGRGTHWAGEIDFSRGSGGEPRVTIGSHGNFIFGQGWSQETSEGVIVELSFVGERLVQTRLHPYAILDQAQPNLLDPQGDGRHVLERIFGASNIADD